MKKTARMPIRVVFYRDESDKSIWVAHCLEFDLIGHGKTLKKSLKMLTEAIGIQLKNTLRSGNFKNLFTPAPAECQMMYAQGRDITDGELKITIHCDEFEIDEVNIREYEEDAADKELALA
jgi:predicted RNase H-like HicB family nuclease